MTARPIKVMAWRCTGKNPCDDPPVTISLAPVEKAPGLFPWVMPLGVAQAIFGSVVDEIGENPSMVLLTLTITTF